MHSNRSSPPTVLVVDDQEGLTRLMRQSLEHGGFQVLTANNGAEALELLRGAAPPIDLLVTDYSMPGMTGLELAQECCRIDGELGVLYVSGSSPGDDLRSDLKAARHGFLAKPFRQSELLHSARALLNMDPSAASLKIRGSQTERFGMEG